MLRVAMALARKVSTEPAGETAPNGGASLYSSSTKAGSISSENIQFPRYNSILCRLQLFFWALCSVAVPTIAVAHPQHHHPEHLLETGVAHELFHLLHIRSHEALSGGMLWFLDIVLLLTGAGMIVYAGRGQVPHGGYGRAGLLRAGQTLAVVGLVGAAYLASVSL
ncbi:MAG: hypothetical protein KDD69_08195 [Bdellovibrionales bacterium]|nr:hypothetical protein [Bdellovibrionales bacterium]